MKRRVLVGCEESGVVRDAFKRRGWDAWSNDLVAARRGGKHLQKDVTKAIKEGGPWDLIILHPDCTALALSGNRHYGVGMPKHDMRLKAIKWTVKLWKLACATARVGVALENPMSVIFQYLPSASTQFVELHWFGHLEQKRTGLALYNLPKIVETNNVYEAMMKLPKSEREKSHYMSPSPTRKRDRSETRTGLAEAMATQWSRIK